MLRLVLVMRVVALRRVVDAGAALVRSLRNSAFTGDAHDSMPRRWRETSEGFAAAPRGGTKRPRHSPCTQGRPNV
eukprot:5367161-Alexandrium_andersonii.AAC.2